MPRYVRAQAPQYILIFDITKDATIKVIGTQEAAGQFVACTP
jgi:hypothetical protein